MVDQDVERILADIRAQVIGESSTGVKSATQGNGSAAAPERVVVDHVPPKNSYASLTVLARAWDRLPPLVTNRTGTSAGLELWIKAKIRRTLRWITWEQVNFNAATHHTFIEVIETLTSCEQRLASLQSQLNAEAKTTREQLELHQRELDSQREDFKIQVERQLSTLNQRQSELLADVRVLQIRFSALVNESRERDESLLDEQQTSFKQLSLELTESQVLYDRARRELEALASSEQRLENVQSQLEAEAKTTRDELESRLRELNSQREDLETQVERQQAAFNQRQSNVRAEVEVLKKTLNEFESRLSKLDDSRFSELVNEFRERDERLLDEQRVCFKQFSLELTESQVSQDRTRRELETRIAKLEEQ